MNAQKDRERKHSSPGGKNPLIDIPDYANEGHAAGGKPCRTSRFPDSLIFIYSNSEK